MISSRLGDIVFSVAAIVLAVLRDGAGADGGSAWAAPGSPAGLALGAALATFWILGAVRMGILIARRINPEARRAGRALWSFLYGYLYIMLCVAAAGAVGRIDAVSLTVLAAVAVNVAARGRDCAGALSGDGSEEAPAGAAAIVAWVRDNPLAAVIIGAVGAITLVNAVWAFLLPPFAHDDFTYHLVFPVEWMQSGTLSIKAVPFGNHSPPYYPMNTEMFYLWLFLPFREVFHLNAAQVVFLVFAALALYEIFRRCGASVRAAGVAASVFCIGPVVVEELSKAYVDVAFACFFLIALNAALAFRGRPTAGRAAQFAVAAGIFAGTKIPGIAYFVLILLPLFVIVLFLAHRDGGLKDERPGPVRHGGAAAIALLCAALFIAAGGWWYLRNLLLTGNPVFPLTVEVFGTTLFPGAYGRDALPTSHIETLGDLYSTSFMILLGIGAIWTVIAAALSLSRGERNALPVRAFMAGILLPAAMAAVFHFLIPYDYARFVLALCGLSSAVLLVPLCISRRGIAAAVQVAICAALLAMAVVDADRAALLLPCHVIQRLEPSFAVWGTLALGCAGVVLCGAVALFHLSRGLRTLLTAVTACSAFLFIAAAGMVADLGGAHFTKPFRTLWEPYVLVHQRYPGSSVAVAGTNRSFLLYGRDFSNRVRYVNVNANRDRLFHDHVANYMGSPGELVPGYQGAAYYRRNADYEAWLANLQAFGADILVVERLTPENIGKGYARDPGGFPLEALWAEQHGEKFKRVYASQLIRIYEIL